MQVENRPQEEKKDGFDDESVASALPETWAEWWDKTYGTPNDWIEASPALKAYQESADGLCKNIGQWAYDSYNLWLPPEERGEKQPPKKEREMQAMENVAEE